MYQRRPPDRAVVGLKGPNMVGFGSGEALVWCVVREIGDVEHL